MGQALAGYGIMWNTRYVKANNIPEPKEWADLTKAVYFGHVANSSPSRSGTVHLTVETILQGEGWAKGWEQLMMISGNCAAITERSFGVPDGVSNGQFGVGLVIDFFGLAAKNSGQPVEFVYPSVTSIVPANIALVAGARAPKAASASSSSRSPTRASSCSCKRRSAACRCCRPPTRRRPPGYPNPFAGTIKAKVNFDSDLSESRYYVVLSMFDQLVTFRHKELVAATKAIHDAEKRLGGQESAQLDEARRLALHARRSTRSRRPTRRCSPSSRRTRRTPRPRRRRHAVEEEWAAKAKANYAKAAELASRGEVVAARAFPLAHSRKERAPRGCIALPSAPSSPSFVVSRGRRDLHGLLRTSHGGFTAGALRRLRCQISLMRESFANSLFVAGMTVAFATVIAVPLAYFTMRFQFRGAL